MVCYEKYNSLSLFHCLSLGSKVFFSTQFAAEHDKVKSQEEREISTKRGRERDIDREMKAEEKKGDEPACQCSQSLCFQLTLVMLGC